MSDMSATHATSCRPEWAAARRIVVKIGSALLVERDTGQLKKAWLTSLMDDVSALARSGKEVVLVSSGAIALGRHTLKLPKGALELEQSQAAAAVGQISLAHAYQEMAAERGLIAAQVLLTLGDTEERRRYLNARHTIEQLLALKAIPVVNENDTVATTEIRYGDNDRLSARVASMVSADCLVLLSDIDGLYTAPPNNNPDAKHIPIVTEITPQIEAMAGDAGTELSKGGMKTKVEAGKIALGAGTNMVITTGKVLNPLAGIANGAKVTWFLAKSDPVTAKKRWIAGQLEPAGQIFIDAGAEKALLSGKSLLPAGVTRVDGDFDRGDAVIIRTPDGLEIGRGLIAYSREDAVRIIGKRSSEIAAILGYEGRDTLIHRDDMALNKSKGADAQLRTTLAHLQSDEVLQNMPWSFRLEDEKLLVLDNGVCKLEIVKDPQADPKTGVITVWALKLSQTKHDIARSGQGPNDLVFAIKNFIYGQDNEQA